MKKIYLNDSQILSKLNSEILKEISLKQLAIDKLKKKADTATTDIDYDLNKRISFNLKCYVKGLEYSLKLIQDEIFKKEKKVI